MNKKISYRALIKILLSVIIAIGFAKIVSSILEHRYDQPSSSSSSTSSRTISSASPAYPTSSKGKVLSSPLPSSCVAQCARFGGRWNGESCTVLGPSEQRFERPVMPECRRDKKQYERQLRDGSINP